MITFELISCHNVFLKIDRICELKIATDTLAYNRFIFLLHVNITRLLKCLNEQKLWQFSVLCNEVSSLNHTTGRAYARLKYSSVRNNKVDYNPPIC
jgi:hypothetical protein